MYARVFLRITAACMLLLLLLPLVGLGFASSPEELLAGVRHPSFLPALQTSLWTSGWSLLFLLFFGTPLAWWLASREHYLSRICAGLVDLPMVIPPAVLGIALLQTFGNNGVFGGFFRSLGFQIPFSPWAVILAQTIVAAPFYLQSAVTAFGRVDPTLLWVARSLGQTPAGAFFRVFVPIALPGILSGLALAWGRALGEFGATLLFAGNFPGQTQTMPLAIFVALESDVRAAIALSLLLAGVGFLLLVGVRTFSYRLQRMPSLSSIHKGQGRFQ